MRLGRFIPALFCAPCREKSKAEQHRKSHRYTARKMCACSTRYRSASGLAHLAKRGPLRPPFDPPDQGVPPLDPTRRASPSGLPTGAISIGPWTPGPWGGPSLPPRPPFDRRLPPMDPRSGAFAPLHHEPAAFRPCTPDQPSPDWMRPSPGGFAMSSGSQKRQTTARIAVNCTPAQKAAIAAKSAATGLSPSALCLAVMLDAPLPVRRRNPTVNQQAMTRYFGNTAKGPGRDRHWRCSSIGWTPNRLPTVYRRAGAFLHGSAGGRQN